MKNLPCPHRDASNNRFLAPTLMARASWLMDTRGESDDEEKKAMWEIIWHWDLLWCRGSPYRWANQLAPASMSGQTAFNYTGCSVYAPPYLCSPSSCCFCTLQRPISASSRSLSLLLHHHAQPPSLLPPPFSHYFHSLLSSKMRWAILLPLHFNTSLVQAFPFINTALLLLLCECACMLVPTFGFFHPGALLCGTKLPAGYCWDISQGYKQIKVPLQPW